MLDERKILGIADAILNGLPLTQTHQKTRDMFNIRIGGIPKLLPPARIWFANRFPRFCYDYLLERSGLISLINKLVM
jgi:hypothetical protein